MMNQFVEPILLELNVFLTRYQFSNMLRHTTCTITRDFRTCKS